MAGLNGVPVNGSSGAESAPPRDWLRQADAARVETSEAWPATEADEFEAERSRLELEIATAKRRTRAARELTARHEADLHSVLRAMVLTVQAEVAELERVFEAEIASIRQSAHDEAVSIVADARREVSEARARRGGGGVDDVQ